MPENRSYPPCWVLAGVELFGASGQVLFRHGGVDVEMPALDLGLQEGAFDNIRLFANGGVSQPAGTDGAALPHDLIANLNAAWAADGGVGEWTGGYDEDDKFWLSNDSEDWALALSGDNEAYGYPFAGFGTTGAGGPYTRVATEDWVRGFFRSPLAITGLTSGASVSVPTYGMPSQDLTTLLRPWTTDGGDRVPLDVADTAGILTLETLHNDALDPDHRRIRWILELDGRLSIYWPVALTTLSGITWAAGFPETLRVALGASGSETDVVVYGTMKRLTFTYPPKWVLAPATPIDMIRWFEQDTDFVKGVGQAIGVHVDDRNGWTLRAEIEGAAGAGAVHQTGRTAEDMEHQLQRFLRVAKAGHRVTVVRGLDWRRYRHISESSPTDLPYTLVYTAEQDRGALLCQVESNARRDHRYEANESFYSLLELSLIEEE